MGVTLPLSSAPHFFIDLVAKNEQRPETDTTCHMLGVDVT